MKAMIRWTLVALLFAGLTVSSVGATQRQSQKSNNEASRARGLFVSKKSDAMSILVLKVVGGTLVPVDPSTEFKAGDQIKIQFQSNFEGYIYVVNIEPNGKRKLLFPYPEGSNNAVSPGERYDIPPGTTIEFDKEVGTEILQVIMSRGRIPYLDAALKEPQQYLSESAATAAAELKGGITNKVTPVVPQGDGASKVRSRDIILAPGRDKDTNGSVVAIPDTGSGGGKLKAGEIAPFEIRLKHR
jgi:Domain of unknown function (DUF4384)